VTLCELAGRLPGSLSIEDPLHRVEHVTAILCGNEIRQRSVLVYHSDNLWHFRFTRLLRFLDLFDAFIALLGQTGQIVLKADHAVVRGAVSALFNAILFGHSAGVIFTVAEGGAEVLGCVTLLVHERTCSGAEQNVGKINVFCSYLSAMSLAVLE
jgi:hypothetical protein